MIMLHRLSAAGLGCKMALDGRCDFVDASKMGYRRALFYL